MSSPKIKRLKTPLKRNDSFKQGESTVLTNCGDIEQSTISLIKSVQCSESLQVALINEINKVYKEITCLKEQCRRYQQQNSQLTSEKLSLETTIARLQQEMHSYAEMYELETINHQQLRKFYQQRELQWKFIVEQHRKLLEEYDRQHLTSLSKLQDDVEALPTDSINKKEPLQADSIYKSEQNLGSSLQRKQSRKLKTSSLERRSNFSPRLKMKQEKSRQQDYYMQISRLYKQQSKFTRKASENYLSLQKEHLKITSSHKNAEIDDFFDKVLRKTYYKYKERCVSVAEIENMEDMKKLKSANTSTRQRLIKTIKKLNFELTNDHELKVFVECIEKAVVSRFRVLRGDFAFEFLIEKLKECQKLALSSNSQLERLDKQKSGIKDEKIYFALNKLPEICDYNPSELNIVSRHTSQIEKISQKNLELLLNSTIKCASKPESQLQSNSKSTCSISSERNLREGLKDAFNRSEDSFFFRFGRRENMNVDFSSK